MRILSVLAFLILSQVSFGQIFGNSDSFKSRYIKATADLFAGRYPDAKLALHQLDSMQPKNANIAFQLGYCHIQPPVNCKRAIDYLKFAASNTTREYREGYYKETKAPLEVYKYLGDAYRLNYDFDIAIQTYEKFREMLENDAYEQKNAITRLINSCHYAKKMKETPISMT